MRTKFVSQIIGIKDIEITSVCAQKVHYTVNNAIDFLDFHRKIPVLTTYFFVIEIGKKNSITQNVFLHYPDRTRYSITYIELLSVTENGFLFSSENVGKILHPAWEVLYSTPLPLQQTGRHFGYQLLLGDHRIQSKQLQPASSKQRKRERKRGHGLSLF